MSAEENTVKTEKPTPEESDGSKHFFRKKVWNYLETNYLVTFPVPVYGRIPNFKGVEKANAKLLKLEEFQNAKTVEVNPDKPLEVSRSLVIEKDKILYVPVPNLQEGLLKKISFCNEDKPTNIRQIVTRWGIETFGKDVNIHDVLKIDLVVVGSVAVSKEGYRIGKGKGYADLEFAILKEIKAINDDTTIVTIVHDCQVFDSFPKNIFKKHDVPVDFILTPTQIIQVENKLPRPEGIFWDLLTEKALDLMPVLHKLREAHASCGRDITLKETGPDEDPSNASQIRKRSRSRPKVKEASENGNAEQKNRVHRRRFFQRPKSNQARENEDSGDKENDVGKAKKGRPFRRYSGRRLQADFSLVVSNIDPNVRVRHLKDALIDRGIKPSTITWRGYKGVCYLHYAKPMKKEAEEEEKPFGVDNVIEILQTLKLNPESTNLLSVKVMEPITRIETTDVTAV